MSLPVGDINAHCSRWDTNTNEDERGEQLAEEIDAATTPFLTRMKLRGYRQMAGQHRPTSVWPPIISNYYQTGQSLPHWSAIICTSSSPSTPNCPRLTGIGDPTSTSIRRTGHEMLKPATNTMQKLAKQELSNQSRRPLGKQRIRPVVSSFRSVSFNTSNQPCWHQPNRSPINETEKAD